MSNVQNPSDIRWLIGIRDPYDMAYYNPNNPHITG